MCQFCGCDLNKFSCLLPDWGIIGDNRFKKTLVTKMMDTSFNTIGDNRFTRTLVVLNKDDGYFFQHHWG